MPYNVQPAVIGCAILPSVPADRESLEELIYRVSQAALRDAGLAIEDIDGIVVGANDQLDGRAISVMAASGSVGGVDRDILSTPSSAEHAFVLGALRVATGQFRTQLVVAWSPTEASPLREVERLAADPYFHRRLPLDELAAAGLQAGALEHQAAGTRRAALTVAEKNRRNGALAYPGLANADALGAVTRWPLREGMVGKPVTGAVALVLAGADEVARRGLSDAVWVRGMGWATEGSFLGDRNLATVPSLQAAAEQAFREAGINDPASAFDLAEVADFTPYQELLAYEGLGFCARGEWEHRVAAGAFGPSGTLPVNLSGGSLTCNPVYCTGLIRIAEIANQLRGRAGPHQRANARRGIAHAASGFAMQYNTVIVLDRDGNPANSNPANSIGSAA
jgi:acetyl-CoA C-acetyltransferase